MASPPLPLFLPPPPQSVVEFSQCLFQAVPPTNIKTMAAGRREAAGGGDVAMLQLPGFSPEVIRKLAKVDKVKTIKASLGYIKSFPSSWLEILLCKILERRGFGEGTLTLPRPYFSELSDSLLTLSNQKLASYLNKTIFLSRPSDPLPPPRSSPPSPPPTATPSCSRPASPPTSSMTWTPCWGPCRRYTPRWRPGG